MLEYQIAYIATNGIFVFAVFKLLRLFFKDKVFNKRIEFISFITYFLLSGVMVLVTILPLILLLINFACMFMLSFNYQSSLQRKLLASSLTCSILLVIEIVVIASMGFLDLSITTDSNFNSIVGLILIRTISAVFAQILNKNYKSFNKDLSIPKIYFVCYSMILIGSLYLFATALENDNLTIANVFLIGAVLISINITMIYIDDKIINSMLISYERNKLYQQNIAYEKQTEIINQSNRSIKILKHDMKNHLNMLNEMFKNNKRHEIEKYMKEIVDEIGKRNISESGNFAIDSILNFKLSQFEDIKLFIDVKIPQTIGISATDITIILGNLLDNAIKATLKTDEKFLKIKISCKLENLVILIDNSYNKEYQDTNYTNIENKSEHGLGLISVKNALEKYGGEIQIKQTDSLFMVSVIIPSNKQ